MEKLWLFIRHPVRQSNTIPLQKQRQGILWIVGSFALCPCHLPLTLGLLVTVLGGTAFGAFFIHNLLFAGIGITLLWAAGTWYGFRQLRSTTCSYKPKHPRQGVHQVS